RELRGVPVRVRVGVRVRGRPGVRGRLEVPRVDALDEGSPLERPDARLHAGLRELGGQRLVDLPADVRAGRDEKLELELLPVAVERAVAVGIAPAGLRQELRRARRIE